MEPRYGQWVRVETGARDHSWKPLTTSSRPDACTDPCTRCRLRPPHASLIDRREMTSIYSAISLWRTARSYRLRWDVRSHTSVESRYFCISLSLAFFRQKDTCLTWNDKMNRLWLHCVVINGYRACERLFMCQYQVRDDWCREDTLRWFVFYTVWEVQRLIRSQATARRHPLWRRHDMFALQRRSALTDRCWFIQVT